MTAQRINYQMQITYQLSLLLGGLVEAAERVLKARSKLPQRIRRGLPGRHDGRWRRETEERIANRGAQGTRREEVLVYTDEARELLQQRVSKRSPSSRLVDNVDS